MGRPFNGTINQSARATSWHVTCAHRAEEGGHGASLTRILALSAGPAVALGFARFAYGLLLPMMSAGLGWSYGEAGAMNAANAVGYLAGALAAAPIGSRLGLRRIFLLGLAASGAAMLAFGMADGFILQLLLRLLAGFAAGPTFVLGAVLAAETGGTPRWQANVIATYFGGAGAGITVSAVVISAVIETGLGWRAGWLVLGTLACVAVVPAQRALRDSRPHHRPSARPPWRMAALAATYGAHALFGAGYIAYMTFVVALLRSEAVSPNAVVLFWAVLGMASTSAGFFWGNVLARLPGGWGMALVLCLMSLGAALPQSGSWMPTTLLSAVLFGAAVMAMPSAVTVLVRRLLPEPDWAPTLGRLTVAFGVGQVLGPLLSGVLSDSAFGLRLGLAASPCILLAGAAIAILQREPPGLTNHHPAETIAKPNTRRPDHVRCNHLAHAIADAADHILHRHPGGTRRCSDRPC